MCSSDLLSRAQAVTSIPVAVVMAKRELEAWFVASLSSVRGHRTLASDSMYTGAAEDLRDPKEWLAGRMTKGYSETLDQAAFAAKIDVGAARVAAPSFAKLVRDLARLLGLTLAASA